MRREYWRCYKPLVDEAHRWYLRLEDGEAVPDGNTLRILRGDAVPDKAIGLLDGPIEILDDTGFYGISKKLAKVIGYPEPIDVTEDVIAAWEADADKKVIREPLCGRDHVCICRRMEPVPEQPIYGGRPASIRRYPSVPPGAKVSVHDNPILLEFYPPVILYWHVEVEDDVLFAKPSLDGLFGRSEMINETYSRLDRKRIAFPLTGIDHVTLWINGRATVCLREELETS